MSAHDTMPPLLARLIRRFRRAQGRLSTPALGALLRELEPACEELLEFGRTSDHEFTTLARGVAELQTQLEAIRQQTEALDRTLHDADDDRALSSAYALYKSSVDLVHSSVGIAMSEQQEMTVVETGLRRVCAAREEFKRNSLLFRMIAMGVRMEASRLDADSQGTFLNVAIDIASIEQQMTETTEAAFERIAQVIHETESERDQVARLQSTLHERAHASIRTIQQELSNVETALQPCAQEVRDVTRLLQKAQGGVGGLIRALQFQDIVRQKLEHVTQGFDELIASSADDRRPTRDTAFVRHAAHLQAAQLRQARTEIDRAAHDLTSGLDGLLATSEELLGRYNGVRESATHAFRDCRVAELFRSEIQQLSHIARQSEQTNQTISRLAVRIEEIIHVFGRDIAKHQFDVRLVSLNAQIAAARLPSADALNRIAEEAIHVSVAHGEITRTLATELEQTLDRIKGIKNEAQEFLQTVSSEKTALEFGATDVSAKLQRFGDRIQQESIAINERFQAANAQVRGLLDQVEFPAEIEAAFGPAQRGCQSLLDATAASAGAILGAAAVAQLAAHRQRYTMETEHATHTAATHAAIPAAPARPEAVPSAPAPASASATAAAPSSQAAESFGDGIELF